MWQFWGQYLNLVTKDVVVLSLVIVHILPDHCDYGYFSKFKMATSRHFGFLETDIFTISSALPETPTLESNIRSLS